jgi:sodium transport system permease protein
MTQPLIIARKELIDHARDVRSVALSTLYALMGPAVALLAIAQRNPGDPSAPEHRAWTLVAAVFALMAAFTGAMAPAMDTIAGERERKSLVPLIASAFSRRQVIVGKWIALSAMSIVSLTVCVVAFVLVLTIPGGRPFLSWTIVAPAVLSLGMLAAAAEILISTLCRSTKEANTYMSLFVFAIMGLAMWIAFRPPEAGGWSLVVPLLGQQRLLAAAFAGASASLVQMGLLAVQSVLLAGATAAAAVLLLGGASKLFQRDEAVYGG